MRIYKKGKESHLFNDLIGKKIGKLTPIEYQEFITKRNTKEWRWQCKCDCGNICYIRSGQLTTGKRIDCKECSKKRQSFKQKLPSQLSILHRIYRNYKIGAKNRLKVFELSLEEFKSLLKKECYYCGALPKFDSYGYERNGIDRIDSNGGYTIENTVSCCEICNQAKMEISRDDFFQWINIIYNNLKNKNLI